VERRAFHAGHEFHQARVTNIQDEPIDDLVAEVAMGHLAALEPQRRLYLIALAQKADGLVLLGLVIMFVDGDREFDLFDDNDFLLLACGAVALVLIV
jgi:hypothetical protein